MRIQKFTPPEDHLRGKLLGHHRGIVWERGVDKARNKFPLFRLKKNLVFVAAYCCVPLAAKDPKHSLCRSDRHQYPEWGLDIRFKLSFGNCFFRKAETVGCHDPKGVKREIKKHGVQLRADLRKLAGGKNLANCFPKNAAVY